MHVIPLNMPIIAQQDFLSLIKPVLRDEPPCPNSAFPADAYRTCWHSHGDFGSRDVDDNHSPNHGPLGVNGFPEDERVIFV